jgi:DNA-binding beta-propeller fold protein YncE
LPHALLGVLSAGGAPGGPLYSAVEVATSADGRFAFVSLEYAGKIAVFDLRAASRSGFRRSGLVGMIPLRRVNVGVAVSPDGRWLYATGAAGSFPLTPASSGTLSVVDVKRAETHPAGSVVSTVRSGCDPVRVAVSPDGSLVWVTARGSNALLGYAAAKLRRDRAHALVAVVPVGAAPVGLALIDGGRRAIVMDSNRFGLPGKDADLAVVDTTRAVHGGTALLGTIAAGRFPREAAVQPDHDVLLVTNFDSFELQAVRLADLP